MVDVNTLTLIDVPNSEENEIVFIEQFVHDVVGFSSQYGSDISISYTAYNITGKPSKFPDYGDFPQAFVMVCYIWYYIKWEDLNITFSTILRLCKSTCFCWVT